MRVKAVGRTLASTALASQTLRMRSGSGDAEPHGQRSIWADQENNRHQREYPDRSRHAPPAQVVRWSREACAWEEVEDILRVRVRHRLRSFNLPNRRLCQWQ